MKEKEWQEKMNLEIGKEKIKADPMLNYLINGGRFPINIVHISKRSNPNL